MASMGGCERCEDWVFVNIDVVLAEYNIKSLRLWISLCSNSWYPKGGYLYSSKIGTKNLEKSLIRLLVILLACNQLLS